MFYRAPSTYSALNEEEIIINLKFLARYNLGKSLMHLNHCSSFLEQEIGFLFLMWRGSSIQSGWGCGVNNTSQGTKSSADDANVFKRRVWCRHSWLGFISCAAWHHFLTCLLWLQLSDFIPQQFGVSSLFNMSWFMIPKVWGWKEGRF